MHKAERGNNLLAYKNKVIVQSIFRNTHCCDVDVFFAMKEKGFWTKFVGKQKKLYRAREVNKHQSSLIPKWNKVNKHSTYDFTTSDFH